MEIRILLVLADLLPGLLAFGRIVMNITNIVMTRSTSARIFIHFPTLQQVLPQESLNLPRVKPSIMIDQFLNVGESGLFHLQRYNLREW